MRRISFISNSKAALIAAASIVAIELFIHYAYAPSLSYKKGEETLEEINEGIGAKEYLLLGDSVGSQISQHLATENAAHLASNQAQGMPGYYFMVLRYLKSNPPPRLAALITHDTFEHDLNAEWVDHFFQRHFNRMPEILDVLSVNFDLEFAFSSLAYGLIPSYKYRLKIAERLLPATFKVDARFHEAGATATRSHSIAGILRLYLRERFTPHPVSEVYFGRLAALFDRKGIPLLFIPVPISESRASAMRQGNPDPQGMLSPRRSEILHNAAAAYPQLRLIDEGVPTTYPDSYFHDAIHFKGDLLPKAVEKIRRALTTEAAK